MKKIKKVNVWYYTSLLLVAFGIFLYIFQCEEPTLWMLAVVMFYGFWMCLSQFLFYAISKKRLKKHFQSSVKLSGEAATFWVDEKNQEMAVLCLFHPFQIQYIALNAIENMSIVVQPVNDDKKYAAAIYLDIVISDKKYRFQLLRRSKQQYIDMERIGNNVVCETEEFIRKCGFK